MMNKLLAVLCAGSVLAACTACSMQGRDESSAATESAAPENTTAATAATVTSQTTEPVEFEQAVVQKPGEAALYITDARIFVQYWGRDSDVLTYGAGVAKITGDGEYTVSVDAGTKGAQYDISNGTATEGYECEGIGFAGIVIRDGESLMPAAILTVDKILVDGREIPMTAKNYTNTEDGHIRTNIINPYISTPSGDARSTEGYLYRNNDNTKPALEDAGEYSPKIINADEIGKWTKIEVQFTVSGYGSAGLTTAPAETTTEETSEPAALTEETATDETAETTETAGTTAAFAE